MTWVIPLQAESHLKLAEMLQAEKRKNNHELLDHETRSALLSAFNMPPEVMDEFE